ncbi:MAG: tetratricopeptide repeat protein [Candidatus Thiodiazotropha taylori]
MELGLQSKKSKDYNKALEYFNAGLEQARAQGNNQYVEQYLREELSVYRHTLPQGHTWIATSLGNLAKFYSTIERYSDAEPLYREALAIRRKALPEDHEDIAVSLNNLANLHKNTDRYQEAESLYRESLDIYRKALPEGHTWIAIGLNNLASLLETTGRYEEAEPLYREALAIDRKALPEGHTSIARDLNNLAGLLETTGRYEEAEPLYREALAIDRKALPVGHTSIAIRLNNLALLLKTTGRYEEAEPLHREALAIYRKALPEGHSGIATGLNHLAGLLETTGRYEEAEPLYREALAIYRKALPEGHTSIARGLNNLAGLLKTTGRYEEAEPLYREALAIDRKALPEGHTSIATDLNHLAALLAMTGRYEEAEPLYRETLAIYRKALPEGHTWIATGLNNLADLLDTTGRYEEAEPLYREALAIDRKALPEGHTSIAIGLGNLAFLLKTTGRYEEAEPLYREALAIFRKALPEGHTSIAIGLNNLAELLRTTGRYEEAEPLYRESLTIFRKALPEGHSWIANGLNNLAELLRTTGRYEEAEPLYREALAINRKALPEGHRWIAIGLNNLAFLLTTTGRYEEAEPIYREALAINRKALPEGHSLIATGLSNLAFLLMTTGRYEEAEPLYREAYQITDEAGEPRLQWRVRSRLQQFYKIQALPNLAIYYGKQTVNTLQQNRRTNVGMEKEAKQAFLKSVEHYYKSLADLLIDQGRLPEAQQVLAMLKEEELHQFLRRSSEPGSLETQATYTNREKPWAERYQKIHTKLASIGAELRTLQQKKKQKQGGLDETEKTRYRQLKADRKVANEAFNHYLDELYAFFTQQEGERSAAFGEKHLETASLKSLQHQLGKLGEGALVLHYLVTDERVRILITSPTIQIHRDSDIDEAELNRLIHDFRQQLQSPKGQPQEQAQVLYKHLIAPIEQDLKTLGAKVLMVSLDGALRYIPLAALHDGEQWLAQRYGIVLYTAAAKEQLNAQRQADWSVAGLGVSQGGRGLSPLPAVKQELDAIVQEQDKPKDRGVLPGEQLLDEAFTPDQLSELLEAGHPVVHLASHFVFKGNDVESYLLLGNEEKLSLYDFKVGDYPLGDVDLLTLSACETALGGGNANGREIEGFGALAQKAGANSVLATLWSVADESTGQFMKAMYERRETQGLSKLEALRQTQLAMLGGELRGEHGAGRGFSRDDRPNDAAKSWPGYSHPFYWAPFILMGNWL